MNASSAVLLQPNNGMKPFVYAQDKLPASKVIWLRLENCQAYQLTAVMQKVTHMRTRRLLIIGFLIFIALGRIMPMTLMPEPGDPWYLTYTTTWFLAAGILFVPSALVTEAVGLSFSGVAHLFVDAAWLITLCLIIYFNPFSATLSADDNS
jgi:hypothetical protein